MPFIVESGPLHPGIKLYVTKAEPPSRSIVLEGRRDDAVQYPARLDAEVASKRFSSLYGLIVTEINSTGNPEGTKS